ncbi:MAG: T9SS type A sorting domain-containing protein [Bacteroidetes bacterium]|nr:MAG: T9SS type A sorting domain-containing protein [Bacteroidota bacterium]
MLKIRLFLIFAGISIILMMPCKLPAELRGEIRPPEFIQDSIVDYGICLVGDSLSETFILRNTGDSVLKIGTSDPSYYRGKDPFYLNHQNDYTEFKSPFESQLPYLLDVGKEQEIKMTFTPSDTSPSGKKYVLLKLGLFDARIQENPDSSQLTVFKVFLLIARKTTHYIDGYENDWDFDSVYINPPVEVSWTWQVKNVWSDSLRIDTQELRYLSPNPEFEIKGDILPYEIYSKNVRNWEISYNPKDLGGDSAIYTLSYHPHPIQYPNTIDSAVIKLHGIGVKQHMALYSSNVNIHRDTLDNGDTLDIGEVWVDSTKDAYAVLKNNGNLKFGTVSQTVWNNKNVEDSVFTLTQKIKELPFHLDTNKTDTFRIKFSPKQRGTFISRYILNSDIASRKIKGIPAEGLNEVIYLRGKGIEPEISVAQETLNFGNVVWCFDFPTSGTFSLQLNNLGNTTLHIQDPIIDPPFTVPNPIDTIAAYSQRTMQIVFNATELGDYSDTLFIISKDVRSPKDTLKLIVKASSVRPQATRLFIPNVTAKPGRLISIPIIVDKRNINTARTFNDTLTYDASLLRYYDYEKTGTASESAALIIIKPDSSSSRLSIYIEKTGLGFFEQSDTLILLKFNTYLGDKVSTPIAFADPRFGNGPCSKVLTPNTTNGKFTLDSICGLSLKAIPYTTKKFRFEDIYPNPAFDKIQFEYEMAFSTEIKINLYDSYGELVEKLIDSKLPEGTYQLTYPTNEMSPGVYYFEMQAGLFRQIKKVVLTK